MPSPATSAFAANSTLKLTELTDPGQDSLEDQEALRQPLLPSGEGDGGAISANLIFSCLGNAFEWYDFAVFGFIAPELSKEIFPSNDTSTGLIEAFSVYAVAFLCRPISGLLLGFLGDKWGRKNTITLALVLMGAATLMAGATPGYALIGIWSPLLLCVSRMAQGLSVGAQTTGTFLLVLEKSLYKRHGMLSAVLIASQLSGFILGGLVPAIMRLLISPEAMRIYGWRLCLWIGLIPCVITLFTHAHVTDEYTESQRANQEQQNQGHGPLDRNQGLNLDVLGICIASCIYFGGSLVFYLNMVWLPVHLQATAGPAAGLAGTIAVSVFALCLIPIAGKILDSGSPYLLGGSSRFLNACVAVPLTIFLLSDPCIQRYAIVMTVMIPILAFDFVSTTKLLVPYFPAEGRYISMAVANNAGVGLTGGTAPMVAQYLVSLGEKGHTFLGIYVSIALLISGLAVLAMYLRPRCYFPGGPHDNSFYSSVSKEASNVPVYDKQLLDGAAAAKSYGFKEAC
mmetsp:Transcript_2388/g.3457  ORF Transcript_2388/g.3457 Transcript_2388/m.3457 type:complete len:512 (-) Transcript_2388:223-1758(-)|eukprot:CAMPEP_0184481002 /NCGR_PEP_ID=MMETSP0113_2-20130426/2543_1 /TAXON_ID=91329 /ORGANISM="Norrisiella sphaerica, Strain BC52" /LENGTH=511 /DNA_ID=CAMNT_0026859867 /DNA_START=245 /DNA_END=1780 /DNA_ORIENTATION=-